MHIYTFSVHKSFLGNISQFGRIIKKQELLAKDFYTVTIETQYGYHEFKKLAKLSC